MIRSTAYCNKLVRTSAVLTNSYVAGTVIGAEDPHPTATHEFTQAIVNFSLTLGSLTTAHLKIEFSHDNSTFYQETSSTITNGTDARNLKEYSFSSTGNYRISVPILDRYIKISVKGTGDVTDSSCGVNVNLGIN